MSLSSIGHTARRVLERLFTMNHFNNSNLSNEAHHKIETVHK